jgi:cyclic dehypoxanthinyl futalosine synthase
VTQGREIGQLALLFGANDMGSLMLEENVVSAAGTVHHLTLAEMRSAISELGWIPRRRNVFYELFEDDGDGALPMSIPAAATGRAFAGCGTGQAKALLEPTLLTSSARS